MGSIKLADLYAIYRDYIKHEVDLVNQRSTWHLVIQGFLFATLGYLGQWQFSRDLVDTLHTQRLDLVFVLSGLGFLVAVLAFVSISAANNATNALCEKWSKMRPNDPDEWELLPEIAGGGHRNAKKFGIAAARVIPLFIAAAWLAVGGMAIHDRLHPPTSPTSTAEQGKSAQTSPK